MTRIFTIRPDRDIAVWFSLHICPTRKAMNAHITAWAKKTGHVVTHEAATAGLVQPAFVREFPAEGKGSWYSDNFATVFLNDADLRTDRMEIIAHEGLHCALAHERFVQHFSMEYGGGTDSNMEHEERLCYTHGRIVVGIQNALRKAKK
jgi:hypothetical protein